MKSPQKEDTTTSLPVLAHASSNPLNEDALLAKQSPKSYNNKEKRYSSRKLSSIVELEK